MGNCDKSIATLYCALAAMAEPCNAVSQRYNNRVCAPDQRRFVMVMTPTRPTMLARIIRLRDAPTYLGMNRNCFNARVRPVLTELPIGVQGIGFDRLELDAWVDDYVARNGRPGRKGQYPWDAKDQQVSSSEVEFGTSKKTSKVGSFAEALVQIDLKKQK